MDSIDQFSAPKLWASQIELCMGIINRNQAAQRLYTFPGFSRVGRRSFAKSSLARSSQFHVFPGCSDEKKIAVLQCQMHQDGNFHLSKVQRIEMSLLWGIAG